HAIPVRTHPFPDDSSDEMIHRMSYVIPSFISQIDLIAMAVAFDPANIFAGRHFRIASAPSVS
ncbi:MAG TPA: hypothetical protein PLK77_03965, partial [Pyrinomonadaceae bacterium]|nr:hypothetical protein [Pyrinomonadaceae bacterium]